MRKKLVPAIFMALLAALPQAQAATWTVDAAHSSVQFAVKHMMISTVRGYFNSFSGTATTADSALSDLSVRASIDAASIDTRQDKRDAHLRSADFFDTEKYPTITFVSKASRQVAPGKLQITGDLTLRGVTKEIVFDVDGLNTIITDTQGNARTAAVATATIKRGDFGLTYNTVLEAGGVAVSDEVGILLDLELVQTAEQASGS